MKPKIEIHGVPMDLGANLRGVDMGPSALRIAGIEEALLTLGYDVEDYDEVHRIPSRIELPPDKSAAKYLGPIAEACRQIHDVAKAAKGRGSIPLFLGGDHSIAMGTISGVASHFRDHGEAIGLIWFDAHADMNTPDTSPSGNVHGMPFASVLGYGPPELTGIGWAGPKVRPENTTLIGIRDVDISERDVVSRAGIQVFSMHEIDLLGMAEVTRRAVQRACNGTAGIHLSFDIDGLDAEIAPGVGTPVRGGVNFREAHLMLELIADTRKLLAMDVVELNPVRDIRNTTAELVVHLVQSAFGRRIV